MARPRLEEGKAKGLYVRVRVTASEREEIRRRAKKANAATVSIWVRERLLGK